MVRALCALPAILALAALAAGCGDDCPKLAGSQCELINCHFDELESQLYTTSPPALKFFYKRNFETGSEYAAIMVIGLDNLDPTQIEGLHLEGEEFLNRVTLYRPDGEMWPDFTDGKCDVTKGGEAVNEDVEGKCSFRFDNGYSVTAAFCDTLEDPGI